MILTKNLFYCNLKIAFFTLCFNVASSGVVFGDSTESNLLVTLEDALVSLSDKVRPSVVSLSPYVPPSPSTRRQGDRSIMPANAGS